MTTIALCTSCRRANKNESGLTQLLSMGESIRQIWVYEKIMLVSDCEQTFVTLNSGAKVDCPSLLRIVKAL